MRAAVWLSSSTVLPRLEVLTAQNATSRELVGLLESAPSAYNARADPRGSDAQRVDCGDIGEDSQGIWLRRHPEVLIMEDAALWAPVDRYRRGLVDLTPQCDEALSAFESSCAIILAGAHHRAVMRGSERGPQS